MALWEMTPEALGQFAKLPKVVKARVLKRLQRLEDNWPQAQGKPLTKRWKGSFSLRVGDYRVLYRVEQGAVVVHRIGHRSEVYEDRQ